MTGRLSKRSEDRPPDGEFGAIAQLGERLHGMQEVDGSRPCQGRGREFESRFPLQILQPGFGGVGES